MTYREFMDIAAREFLTAELAKHGSITKTAKALGLNRSHLHALKRRFRIRTLEHLEGRRRVRSYGVTQLSFSTGG